MKFLLSCILCVCLFSFESICIAQEVYTGSLRHISSNSTEIIDYTFLRYHLSNTYFNRYSIFRKSDTSEADTIYTVQLNFDQDNKNIEILQKDTHTGQYSVNSIIFRPLSYLTKRSNEKPIYSVKDFEFNDTTLSVTKDNNSRILFTVYDTLQPIIYLHQLITIDSASQINLDKFRQSHLKPHLSHAMDFWIFQKSLRQKFVQDSISHAKDTQLKLSMKQKITEEIKKIEQDKDSVYSAIELEQQKLRLIDVPANSETQKLFERKMNRIFLDYYKPDTIDKSIQANYEILCTVGHKIEIAKTPRSKSLNYNDLRFNYEYLASIDTAISHIWLENEKVPLFDKNPYSSIVLNHKNRFEKIKPQFQDLNIDNHSEFDSLLNKIKVESNERFGRRLLEVPTKYSCPFNYASTTKWERWKLVKKKITNPSDSIIDPNGENYSFFFRTYPKAKNGKYMVRVNSVKINDNMIGPTAIEVLRKYKFTTRIGVSGGVFFPVKKQEEISYDRSKLYYDYFIVYHHFGVFAGYGNYQNQSLISTIKGQQKYYEGGIYVAPGNVLYFKLGFSQYTQFVKSSLRPIAGISMIFPFFQIESGYNFNLDYVYCMAGLNIPINR